MNSIVIIGAGLCSAFVATALRAHGFNVHVLAYVNSKDVHKYTDLYGDSIVERAHIIGGNTRYWHAGFIRPDNIWLKNNSFSFQQFQSSVSEASVTAQKIFNNPNFSLLSNVVLRNSHIFYINGARKAVFDKDIKISSFKILENIDLRAKNVVLDGDRVIKYDSLIVCTDAIGAASIYSRFFYAQDTFPIFDHPLAYIGIVNTNKLIKTDLMKDGDSKRFLEGVVKRGLVVSSSGARHMVYLRPIGSQSLHRLMVSDLKIWKKYLLIFTSLQRFRAALYLKWGFQIPSRRFEAFAVLQMPKPAVLNTSRKTISYGDKKVYNQICQDLCCKLTQYNFIRKVDSFSDFDYFPGNHFSSTLDGVKLDEYESYNSVFFVGSSVFKGNSYTNTGLQIIVTATRFVSDFVKRFEKRFKGV